MSESREIPLRVDVFKVVEAPVDPSFLVGVLQAAVLVPAVAGRVGARPGVALSVRITSDAELRALNRRFLGEDHATDVLSFPAGFGEDGGGGPDEDAYLGDLALSWPAVVRQAREFAHPVESEAALLCVHGLLHLLGWDHATPDEEAEMTALTLSGLERAGVAIAPERLAGSASSSSASSA